MTCVLKVAMPPISLSNNIVSLSCLHEIELKILFEGGCPDNAHLGSNYSKINAVIFRESLKKDQTQRASFFQIILGYN